MTRWQLVAVLAVVFAVALLGMWSGWRRRGRRQDWLPELPAVPAALGAELAEPLSGLYVGSTLATRWQDRIVAGGLGARAESLARLTEAGALIQRQGSTPIFIPAPQLIDARLEPALAGKVVGRGGLLVLRWRHGDQDLDTGIRADDKTGYPAWITAIEQRGSQ
ncbi:MAG: transporter [Jatrophihabitantaceae bacterium]